MTFHSINHRVTAALIGVALLTAGASGIGLLAVTHMGTGLTATLRTSAVLANHNTGDMMHDALRADVLMAMQSADPALGIAIADVKQDVAGHAKIFRGMLAANEALATEPVTRATLQAIKPALNEYIAGAEQMVDLAGRDPAAAKAAYPKFLQLFEKLEGLQSEAAEKIGARATQAADKARADGTRAQILMSVVLLIGGIVSAWLAVLARRTLVRPLVNLSLILRRLADGDLAVELPPTGRADELGQMADAVEVFKQAAIAKVKADAGAVEAKQRAEGERQAAAEAAIARERNSVVQVFGGAMEKLAAGDLTYRVTDDLAEVYETLREDFNGSMATLEQTLAAIASSATGIQSGSQEITAASDDLSRRTENQAASLEETAAALEEITATVRKTAEGARETRGVAASAKSGAETGGEVVAQAMSAMSQIEGASQQISQIIGVIDEIAFQTNLLALNAGVEAARAGDAGRGFAVVASEVRALAQRSAEAAKEIKALIADSSSKVAQGVRLVSDMGQALEVIVSEVNRINTLVADIAAAAQEQAAGLAQVNVAVNQMDQVTQQNAAMVEQATAASHSLSREATGLSALTGRFRIGLDHAAADRVRAVASVRNPVGAHQARLARILSVGG